MQPLQPPTELIITQLDFYVSLVPRPHPLVKRVWCMSSDFLGLTGCSRSCDYQNALGMVMYYYLEVRESSNNIMLCTRMQVWPHLTFLCLCIMKSHALYMHGESDWCARNQNCYASKPPKYPDPPYYQRVGTVLHLDQHTHIMYHLIFFMKTGIICYWTVTCVYMYAYIFYDFWLSLDRTMFQFTGRPLM